MSGPRILLVVALLVGAALWAALSGDPDSDLDRGLEETSLAFERVEEELRSFDPLFQQLTRRGLMLALKEEHDQIHSMLAVLKARRLHVGDDPSLERRERLPALRQLVEEADQLLARSVHLHNRVRARHEFMTVSSPLLGEARRRRDALLQQPVDDPETATRIQDLAGRFAELEELAKTSDHVLQSSIEQGRDIGHATLSGLRELIDEQRGLMAQLDVEEGDL